MSGVEVSHVEVVQAIQNAENAPYACEPDATCHGAPRSSGIPLIAGKRTFARVYFDNLHGGGEMRVTGELAVSGNGDPASGFRIASINSVHWRQGRLPGLMAQRQDWNRSLNFELPHDAVAAPGRLRAALASLTDISSGRAVTLESCAEAEVDLEPAMPLVCRALVMRYRSRAVEAVIEPTPAEVEVVRRFLERAFPVANVGWSSVRVDADPGFCPLPTAEGGGQRDDEAPSRMMALLIEQVMAHRNQEVAAGRDPRTLYIGLIGDPDADYGGMAMDSPAFPTTHVVAVSAVDRDGATAAHEIAHLLGRHHPGVPDLAIHGDAVGQDRVDVYALPETGPFGFLSGYDEGSPEKIHLGLDVDPTRRSPRVLEHRRWFDLMTYRHPQWPGAYTYRLIYDRLKCIARLDLSRAANRRWTAICRYDLDRAEAAFVHVLASNHATPEQPQEYADVGEFVASRALEHLYWLYDFRHLISADQWREFVLPHLPMVCRADDPGGESPPQAAGRLSVDRYNRFIDTVYQHADPSFRRLLDEQRVARDLPAPAIRLYCDYGNADPGGGGLDTDSMWRRAREVYYRRVGDRALPAFGLFQVTIAADAGTARPPRSVTLMVNGAAADTFTPPLDPARSRHLAETLFATLRAAHDPARGARTDSGNAFTYDIVDGGYHLEYSWPQTEAADGGRGLKAAPTTTIQCRRPGTGVDGGSPEIWDTVYVGAAMRRRIWIDPELVEFESPGGAQPRQARSTRPQRSRPVGERRHDRLVFRVVLGVGFESFDSGPLVASPVLREPPRERPFEPIGDRDARARDIPS